MLSWLLRDTCWANLTPNNFDSQHSTPFLNILTSIQKENIRWKWNKSSFYWLSHSPLDNYIRNKSWQRNCRGAFCLVLKVFLTPGKQGGNCLETFFRIVLWRFQLNSFNSHLPQGLEMYIFCSFSVPENADIAPLIYLSQVYFFLPSFLLLGNLKQFWVIQNIFSFLRA